MKIGEFSELTGLPVKTIRYYSDIGLLNPESIDSDNNYRNYGKEQFKQLNRILSLKEAGFRLREIAEIIRRDIPSEEFVAMLEKKLFEACERELECQNKVSHLKAYINQIKYKEEDTMNVKLNELKINMIKPYSVEFNDSKVSLFSQTDVYNLETPEIYSLPLKINLTAMTDSTNIRLYFGKGEVIFNWECDEEELRIHDPLTEEQFGFAGLGKVPINKDVDITWILAKDKMTVKVNGEIRLETSDMPYIHAIAEKPGLQINSKVGAGSAFGSRVTISKIDIEQI